VKGTREGVIVSYAFLVWGAFHYLLATPGLPKALAERGAS
jgi:hypothetical protein